jgi:hypothetical protein
MRERLVELVDKAKKEYASDVTDYTETDYIVECLLNEGVIVPPCKVGQTVYVVDKRLNVWWQGEVDCVYCNKNSFEYGILFDNDEYGAYNEEDVFFTKEEAEQELKGGRNESRCDTLLRL